MTDSILKNKETKLLASNDAETMTNKIIDLEQYESVIRQQKKVLTRMDEVLDNCTNITPEETSDWKEFWTNLKESSSKSSK